MSALEWSSHKIMKIPRKHLALPITIAICAISPVNAASPSHGKYYDEEAGRWYTVPRKPAQVIHSQDLRSLLKKGESISTSSKAPENWTVRALYSGPGGDLLEFDQEGKIVYNSSDPTRENLKEEHSMRQVLANGKPIWINAVVFNMVSTTTKDKPGYSFAFAPIGIVRSEHGKYCPVRDIDPIKHQTPSNGVPVYDLDGTCDQSIDFYLGDRKFTTYPGFKKIKDPYFFWSVQYFSDPVTPMYSESGECLRYCDEESRKQEALFRETGSTH